MPADIGDETIGRIRAEIPELPTDKRLRFRQEFDLTEYEAGILTDDLPLSKYYESCLQDKAASPKEVAKWVINEVQRYLNENDIAIADFPSPPARIGALAGLVESGKLSATAGRDVFAEMIASGKAPDAIVQEKGLTQISDADALTEIVDRVIGDNPKIVADWQAGKKAAANALIGPVMRETQGKANPQIVRDLLQERLAEL